MRHADESVPATEHEPSRKRTPERTDSLRTAHSSDGSRIPTPHATHARMACLRSDIGWAAARRRSWRPYSSARAPGRPAAGSIAGRLGITPCVIAFNSLAVMARAAGPLRPPTNHGHVTLALLARPRRRPRSQAIFPEAWPASSTWRRGVHACRGPWRLLR